MFEELLCEKENYKKNSSLHDASKDDEIISYCFAYPQIIFTKFSCRYRLLIFHPKYLQLLANICWSIIISVWWCLLHNNVTHSVKQSDVWNSDILLIIITVTIICKLNLFLIYLRSGKENISLLAYSSSYFNHQAHTYYRQWKYLLQIFSTENS